MRAHQFSDTAVRAFSVTPAQAGAYTHRGQPDVADCVTIPEPSKRMGPGLRRDDSGEEAQHIRFSREAAA